MVKISVLFVVLVVPAVLGQSATAGYEYSAPPAPGAGAAYVSAAQWRQHKFLPLPVAQAEASQIPPHHAQYNYQIYNNPQPSIQHFNYNRYNQHFDAKEQQTVNTNLAHNPSYANPERQRPVITKHVYVHLPPPDETAPTPRASPAPPKKTYNIIFIKLPSQKSASAARLQQLINQQELENKTLIYVLVKKPDTQPVQPITSKPEVFFVKYKEPRNVALVQGGGAARAPVQLGAGLLPGLVNGHGS